jgi:hypothetical protein
MMNAYYPSASDSACLLNYNNYNQSNIRDDISESISSTYTGTKSPNQIIQEEHERDENNKWSKNTFYRCEELLMLTEYSKAYLREFMEVPNQLFSFSSPSTTESNTITDTYSHPAPFSMPDGQITAAPQPSLGRRTRSSTTKVVQHPFEETSSVSSKSSYSSNYDENLNSNSDGESNEDDEINTNRNIIPKVSSSKKVKKSASTTKNVIKNVLNQCITYAKHCDVGYIDKLIQKNKKGGRKEITTIADLQNVWYGSEDYCEKFRKLCQDFFTKRYRRWIFHAQLEDKKYFLKMRKVLSKKAYLSSKEELTCLID